MNVRSSTSAMHPKSLTRAAMKINTTLTCILKKDLDGNTTRTSKSEGDEGHGKDEEKDDEQDEGNGEKQ